MRKIILLLCFMCVFISVFAQKQYFSIVGRTFGKEYIVPVHTTTYSLPYTYIQTEEIPQQGWLSDMNGYFKIDSLQKGKYHLTFSYVGFGCIDTTIVLNDNIQNLKIELSNFSISTPELNLIFSEEEEKKILQSAFWEKYKLRAAWNTKENIQNKVQRITLLSYYNYLRRNQIVFDFLDRKYGYSWRFEAPKGIIGLEETLYDEMLHVKK